MPRLKAGAGPAGSESKPPVTASPSPSLNAFRRAEYAHTADAPHAHEHEHEHEHEHDENGQADTAHVQPERPARAPRASHGSRDSRKSSRVLNCENCREKKMRCDRTNPCSPCALRNLECKWAVEPPDVSAAPSPLRQNAAEIARLRREIKALALQLGLSSTELDAIEDDAERFVRSQDPSPSPSIAASQPSSSAAPKPPPRKRPSISKPLAPPPAPAPAPAPRAPSPPEPQQSEPEPDASYYKRGFSTAGWGSWDRKEPTWAAAPPGPRRYEPTPGWAAPVTSGGPTYEFQQPPPHQPPYGPLVVEQQVRPHGYHPYAPSPPTFAQPPKPLSPVVPQPHSPCLNPHSPSVTNDSSDQQAEVDLPPIRRSPTGISGGERRSSVALPSIGAWFATGHEGERMEE